MYIRMPQKIFGYCLFGLVAFCVLTGLSLELFNAIGFRGPWALATLFGAPALATAALMIGVSRAKHIPQSSVGSEDDFDWLKPRTPVYTGLKDSADNDVYM